MGFDATIYLLQKRYGMSAKVIKNSDLVVNPETGTQESQVIEISVGTVIVLPSRVVAQALAIFRTRDHPGGAFYTTHETIALIDRDCLPSTFKVDMNDNLRLVDTDRIYRIGEILDLHGEQFIELGLVDISGEGVG